MDSNDQIDFSSSDTGIPNDHRRKWDREEFESIAAARLREEEENESEEGIGSDKSPVNRSLLKPREGKLDLESRIGQSRLVKKNSSASTSGYYCDVCDCLVKDSINYLDHVNRKKHQRNMGMSMRLERSTLEQVKNRFELNKQKRAEAKKEYDLEARMEFLQQEEQKFEEERRERRRKRRKQMGTPEESETGADPADDDEQNVMLAMMGFSSFS